MPLLAPLRANGTERDTAGNRRFFFDQYAALLLFYFWFSAKFAGEARKVVPG